MTASLSQVRRQGEHSSNRQPIKYHGLSRKTFQIALTNRNAMKLFEYFSRLWAALCGRPVVVPGLIKDGERWKLMTAAMKRREKKLLARYNRANQALIRLQARN